MATNRLRHSRVAWSETGCNVGFLNRLGNSTLVLKELPFGAIQPRFSASQHSDSTDHALLPCAGNQFGRRSNADPSTLRPKTLL